MKISKKLFVSIFVITLLLILPVNNVSAGTDYVEDFEDDVLGTQAHDTYYGFEWFYSSENSSANCRVDNAFAHSGSKAYRMLDNNNVLFTMNTTDIYNITWWQKRTTAQVGSYFHFQFNNATNQTILETRMTNDGTGKFYTEFQEWDNSWNRIGNDVENTEWVEFTFEITAVDSVTYRWMTDEEVGTPNNIGDSMFNMSIKYVYWWIDAVAGSSYLAIDDFEINTGYEEGEEEESYLPPCDADCQSCEDVGGIVISDLLLNPPDTRNYFLQVYDVVETGNLTRIDLLICDDMAQEITVTDVKLRINNFYNDFPSELVQLENADFWRLSWILNEELPNEPLYFLFRSTAVWGTSPNLVSWYLPYVDYDLNGDGNSWFVNYDSLYGDAYWSMFSTIYDMIPVTTYPNILYDGEMIMRLCIDRAGGEVGLQNFTTDIFVNPNSGCTNKTYLITYFINETGMLYDKRNVTVALGGVNTTYNLLKQDGTFGFVPTEQGTYFINLTINDIVVATDILTINCFNDNYIYTVDNPTFPNQKFRIYYAYTYTTYNARIYIPATSKEWIIFANTSGYKEYEIQYSGTYDIYMQQWNNDTNNYIPIDECKHYVSGTFADSININPINIEVGEYTTISGYHNHIGKDVYVLSNGNIISYAVGDNSEFNFDHYPTASGTYEIKLVLIEGSLQIPLAQSEFDLIVGGDAPTPEDEDFFDNVLGDQKIWLGVGIIIIFLFMPFGLSIKSGLDAPIILYIAMGALGTAISVSLNLVDKSYLLVMCIGLVAGAVISFVKTKL